MSKGPRKGIIEEKDISGELCDACGIGRAIVVACKPPKIRCFFGCSASSYEKPCKGSKAWQRIQVPKALYVEYKKEEMTEEERAAQIKGRFAKKLKI